MDWGLLLPMWWANRELRAQSRIQRFKLLGAEVLVAYLLIAGLAAITMASLGYSTGNALLVVEAVKPGAPADGVLLPGDTIIHAAGASLAMTTGGPPAPSLSSLLQSPEPTEIGVIRNDHEIAVTIHPHLDAKSQRYVVGIELSMQNEIAREIQWRRALTIPIGAAQHLWTRIREAGRRAIEKKEGEFSGPVGIANEVRRQESSAWAYNGILFAGRFFWLLLLCNFICLLVPARKPS